ncbi:MAG: murein biosynthesis integral membrane protein MurJ, partial [Anaerolineae bacterium]|nr:murein biosynthesis integral membrane protein MurJ [Anaerolineae bacterium]
GVVREAAIGRAFGTSAALDAYFAAFEVPEGLNAIVTGAALITALIPLLSDLIGRSDREEVWRLVSSVVNWVLLITGSASLIAAVLARPIILILAPGFAGQPGQVELATSLMRLVLIQTLIFSVSTVFTGTLEAHKHFLLPALGPLCYTLGRIVGAVVLAPHLGIFGLAWGGIGGALAHLAIKLPWLIWRNARWTPVLFHPALPELLRLMGPRVLGMGVTYVTFILPTTFGSLLPPGAISAYEYAWKLMQLPETVLGTAVGTVVFPTLAEMAGRGDRDSLQRTFTWALRLVLALSIPAAVGLVVLGRPLIALLLQRGVFDEQATVQVYQALRFLALGLVTHSMLEVVARMFYARRDMWTPLWAALGGLALNAGAGWVLLPHLAQGAIALANSLGAGLQVIVLLLAARRLIGRAQGWALTVSVARTLLAASVMGLTITALQTIWPDAGTLATGIGGGVAGAFVYIVAAVALGNEEIRTLPRLLTARNRR